MKPMWLKKTVKDYEGSPFGGTTLEGYYEGGYWEVQMAGTIERQWFSFGNVFGKGNGPDTVINDLVMFVWERLCEHFHNKEMHEWCELESSGQSLQENFMIELDIKIGFDRPTRDERAPRKRG